MNSEDKPTLDKPVVPVCYHCGADKGQLFHCGIWEIRMCSKCLTDFHLPHHKTCRREVPKKVEANKKRREQRLFTLHLTRFDGTTLRLRCKLGQEIPMEDHWLGTYIFFNSGLVLVMEDRQEINDRILEGLKSVAS